MDLCWILPNDSRNSAFALALARISANEPFFCSGLGPESVFTGRLLRGLDGSGLLDDVVGFAVEDGRVPFLEEAEDGCIDDAVERLVERTELEDGLAFRLPTGLSAGCGEGLGEFPFDRDGTVDGEPVRGALVAGAGRGSSAAFRLRTAALAGRVALVGEGDGCSPEIDASKSPICHAVRPLATPSFAFAGCQK